MSYLVSLVFQKVRKINCKFDDAGGKKIERRKLTSTRLEADCVACVCELRDVEPRLTRARVELLLLLLNL